MILAIFVLAGGCASDTARSSSAAELLTSSQYSFHSAFALALCGRNDRSALSRMERLTVRREALKDWIDRSEGPGAFEQSIAVADEEESVTDRLCPAQPNPYPSLEKMNTAVRELERRRRAAEKED